MTVRVLNYGGGTNSTALAVEAYKRGLPIDEIVFADTGSERPSTYEYLRIFDRWLVDHGMPRITIVRWMRVRGTRAGQFVTLHDWCESEKSVPSRAFGFSGCTSKWKQQPADKHIRELALVRREHAAGRRVERWIGFDADEPERAERMLNKNPEGNLWHWRAPLVEWDMGRDECVQSIRSAGLPLPGKSACWMCPSSTKADIDMLAKNHPDLLERSLDMEREAIAAGNLGVGKDGGAGRKGLGGRLNWNEYVASKRAGDKRKLAVLPNAEETECGCYDGDG